MIPMQEQLPGANPEKKLGKWMLVIAWLAGLGLLTVFFDEQIANQLNPNRDPISSTSQNGTEVRLKRNRMGHYVSGGEINGVAVTFLLDTGATDVSIPFHLKDQLNLQAGRGQMVRTANGSLQVAQTSISELSIGDIRLTDVRANLNPGMQDDEILLGMSALKQLEFTQRGDWLILRNL